MRATFSVASASTRDFFFLNSAATSQNRNDAIFLKIKFEISTISKSVIIF